MTCTVAELKNRVKHPSKQAAESAPPEASELVWHLGPDTGAVADVSLAVENFLIDFRPLVYAHDHLSSKDRADCLFSFLDRLEALSKKAEEAFSIVLDEHYEEGPSDSTSVGTGPGAA